jgi:hypothetical protein
MNDLSWLLFWADVAPQVANALCFAAFILFIPVVFMYFIGMTDCFQSVLKEDKLLAARFRKLWWAVILLPLLWVLSFLVPDDPKTYYAIAASEMGEEVLKTPEIGKARQALNNWLDEQINGDKAQEAPNPD